jgi:hypothetical protein
MPIDPQIHLAPSESVLAARQFLSIEDDTGLQQLRIIQGMSMGQRWKVAQDLYFSARDWKASVIRSLHPDWAEATILESVRKSFLHAGR